MVARVDDDEDVKGETLNVFIQSAFQEGEILFINILTR